MLSSLKPKLDALGVPLIAVVHEVIDGGAEVREFEKFFAGDIFFDVEKRFFGGTENRRWMGLTGFLRPTVWWNIMRAKRGGFEGNMKGEGRILGGVFVIGKNRILYEHKEEEWGAIANVSAVADAVDRIVRKSKL